MEKAKAIVEALKCALHVHMTSKEDHTGADLTEATEWAIARVIASGELTEEQVDDLRGIYGLPTAVGTALVVGYLEGIAAPQREPGGDPLMAALAGMVKAPQPSGPQAPDVESVEQGAEPPGYL